MIYLFVCPTHLSFLSSMPSFICSENLSFHIFLKAKRVFYFFQRIYLFPRLDTIQEMWVLYWLYYHLIFRQIGMS